MRLMQQQGSRGRRHPAVCLLRGVSSRRPHHTKPPLVATLCPPLRTLPPVARHSSGPVVR